MTTEFNVARLPAGLPVNTGAALGEAFVSAFLAFGISLGFEFTNVTRGPQGPDLLNVLEEIKRDGIPEDVRDKVFERINPDERPQAGDWLAI